MARYDDSSYRRDDEAQREDYDRAAGPEPRRGSLMERRLRAARGEEVDEEQYEEDEDYTPRPRYADRPRRGCAPVYNTGGCATAVLYAVLGVIAVLVILLFAGRQLINSFVPNVPQQVRQIIATPTTTLRDRGGTILQIRSLNRLETQSYSVERVVEARVERGNPLDLLLGDRLLLIASGDVVAGVDLSKLRDSDVTISQDGKSVKLVLPPSEIFSKSLNNERTRVYDRQTGILASENKDLETQARAEAETQILTAACESGVMQKAADEARRSIEQFLRILDFENVTVVGAAGQCVAPSAGPPVPTPAAPTP